MRQDTQRGCVDFLRPHSKLEAFRPKPTAPACPSLVPAGAHGKGGVGKEPLSFRGARAIIPE